jgi:uncharacterized protein (DUF433 family)
LANGCRIQQILDNYPTLTPESLQAVFVFVAESMRDESLYMLPFLSESA